MSKMFTTQLTGLLKRIQDKEEWAVEDAARLLAQGLAGSGTVYVKGFGEMAALEAEALHGAEALSGLARWTDKAPAADADRVLIASRFADDPEAMQFARQLAKAGVPFAAMASKPKESAESLESCADVYIDLHVTGGLLPGEEGGRTGFPSALAALYVYALLKLTIDEILAEYE